MLKNPINGPTLFLGLCIVFVLFGLYDMSKGKPVLLNFGHSQVSNGENKHHCNFYFQGQNVTIESCSVIWRENSDTIVGTFKGVIHRK